MVTDASATTFLFTDIEGSTRLWEQEPARMRLALELHDALVRETVEARQGLIVKMTGDGVHAAFEDPLLAVQTALHLQRRLADASTTGGLALNVRCGMHGGVNQRRDGDFFGTEVNRAARVMSAAHGGQVLCSQYVATLVGDRLPAAVTLRDLGQVRLRDLSTPERVFQVVQAGLRADFPPLRSLEATPNNLPQQATSFIGREHDLREVKNLLANTRLLTLHGAGGIGKTRLSLQIAADLMDDYPDGVWLIELAPLADERLVPQTLASVLGVKEEAGRPILDALTKYLKDKQQLLILDNCEHVIDACAALAKHLLRSCTRVKIMTSSRERLNIGGETTYPVPSLSLPDEACESSIAGLVECEAGRLFLDRAASVRPGFPAGLTDASSVSEICRRLDGIPLAIELAAARVGALSVDQIAARLNDRFRFLTRGDRAALPRQQTLRALIDWSYDLLEERERVLLRRLAVFAGGWTLEAAESVCSDAELDPHDVIDLLIQLVEKSLVALDVHGARYRLLDTVRQYAQERLDESGEADTAYGRQLEFYLAIAEKALPKLTGPSQGEWLARLDHERENILLAHRWCDRSERNAERGLRLAMATRGYWRMRGLMDLGHRITVEALLRTKTHAATELRCQGLFGVGQFCCFMGRYKQAHGYLEEALQIARTLGDIGRTRAALQLLGMASLGQGELNAATRYLDEALAIARSLDNQRDLASALNSRAQLHCVEHAYAEAQPLYEECVALAIASEDRDLIAIGQLNLAMLAICMGRLGQSREMISQALAIADEIKSKPASQSVVEVCAGLAACEARWEVAARLYGAAEAQAAQTGLHRAPADDAFLMPLMLKAQQAMNETLFAAAVSAGRNLTFDDAIKLAGDSLR